MASMTPVSGATEAAASPHVIDVENLEDNNDNTIIDVEKECVKTPSPTRRLRHNCRKYLIYRVSLCKQRITGCGSVLYFVSLMLLIYNTKVCFYLII